MAMKIGQAMAQPEEPDDQEEQGEEATLEDIDKKLDLIMQKLGIAEQE